MSKQKCPVFTGVEEDYKMWKQQINDWLVVEEDNIKYPGIEIRLALKGKSYQICGDIINMWPKNFSGGRLQGSLQQIHCIQNDQRKSIQTHISNL